MFHGTVTQFKLQGLIAVFFKFIEDVLRFFYFTFKNSNILFIGRCLCLILAESRIYTICVFQISISDEGAARQTSHLGVRA
jgi:hypothetical protein